MPKYEVRLESQTDAQSRIVSLDAPSVEHARAHVEQQELDTVNFSLLPPDREVWESPPAGVVDLSRWDAYDPKFAREAALGGHQGAVAMANRRLDNLSQRIDVAPSGKVRGSSLRSRAQARYLAHHQTEPYAVASVIEVSQTEIDQRRTVAALARLKQDPEAWASTLQLMRDAGIPLAAVTAALYGVPWQKQIDGSSVSVWSSAAVQCSLHTAYTADFDTHDFFNDASATEITGTGYTANGVTLASKTSTFDTATDQVRLDAADVSLTGSTLSATDAVIWVNTAGASTTDPVLGNIDFGATVTTTAGTFQIAFDSTGILVFDVT